MGYRVYTVNQTIELKKADTYEYLNEFVIFYDCFNSKKAVFFKDKVIGIEKL